MRASSVKILPLPTLRPAPDIPTTSHRSATGPTATTANGTAIASRTTLNMEGEPFDEDWQRAPGDIAYLHDILQSLDIAHNGNTAGARRTGAMLAEEDVAAQEQRERQMDVIERRRRRAGRRCDAVEAAFARSVERRMLAMQHLAMDPPAERLVGQGMTQYVPAALLPEDMIDAEGRRRAGPLPLLPHSAVESHVLQQRQGDGSGGSRRASSPPVAAIASGPAEADALVFLTQLDADGGQRSPRKQQQQQQQRSSQDVRRRSVSDGVSSGHCTSDAPSHSNHEGEAGELGDDDDEDDAEGEAWMRPANVTASNKDRWRELGYHVVVVGDTSSAGNGTTASTGARRQHANNRRPADQTSASARTTNVTHSNTASRGASPRRWVSSATLPPVCLVQRRLPEEDLSPAELHSRQLSAKHASRRHLAGGGGGGGGGDGRMWKASGK